MAMIGHKSCVFVCDTGIFKVSQPIPFIMNFLKKSEIAQEDRLTIEIETDRLSRNVGS